jgi:hypothetical protein
MGIHPIVSITCGGDSAKSHHSSGFTMGMPSTLAHAQTLRMCGHSSNPWIWPLGDPQCGRFSKRWRVPRSLSKPATLGSSGTHTAKCEVQQLTALYLLCFIMCYVFWQSVSAAVLGHLGCLDLFQITRYRRRRNGRGVEVYPHSWWSSSQLIFPHFPGKQLIVAQKIVVLDCFWAGLPLPLLHAIELFKCFSF